MAATRHVRVVPGLPVALSKRTLLFWRGALLAALCVTLLLAWYPASAGQGNQGLQGGWAIDDSGSVNFPKSMMSTLPLMQEAGAGWVRINFRLGACFTDWTSVGCNTKTALQTYDELVNAALARNLKVLGLLSNESWHGDQAQWVANNAENTDGNGDNAYLRAFSQNAAVPLAKHFANRITAWEVWNEPNAWTSTDGTGQYWGSTFIYPSNFAWLLRHVYVDTRSAGVSGVQFISGGVFGHDLGGATTVVSTPQGLRMVVKQGSYQERRPAPGATEGPSPLGKGPSTTVASGESGASYLRSTYEYGRGLAGWDQIKRQYGSYPLDGIGQHLYIDQGNLTSSSKIRTYLKEVRDAYVAYEGGKTSKKTHVTEFGWRTDAVSEDTQASNLRTSYNTFRKTSYVARAFWFFIQDIPPGLYFGLVRDGGTLKPSFSTYQQAASY